MAHLLDCVVLTENEMAFAGSPLPWAPGQKFEEVSSLTSGGQGLNLTRRKPPVSPLRSNPPVTDFMSAETVGMAQTAEPERRSSLRARSRGNISVFFQIISLFLGAGPC